MRIVAYIDAFNFYYGLTKHSPYRWCNLYKLCQLLLPEGEIEKVKLFAAYSKEFTDNPGQSKRQNTYFQALRTIPQIELITSTYVISEKYLPLCDSPKEAPEKRKVRVPQEKGSDVNFATHLIVDASKNLYDMAAVFTNDSDLTEPLRAVRYDFGKKIYLFITSNREHRRASKNLMKAANYSKFVPEEILASSLLPEKIVTSRGTTIFMPLSWKGDSGG